MSLKFGAATSDVVKTGTVVNNLDPFTLLIWVYQTSVNAGAALLIKGDAGITHRRLRIDDTSGNIGVFINRATDATVITNGAELGSGANNKWTFLALMVDTAATAGQQIKVYSGDLDSEAAESTYGTYTEGSGVLSDDSATIWRIGNALADNDAFLGNIAVVAIVNAALTPNQIIDWQFNPRVIVGTRLLMHLGFAGTGTQPDYSGNNNSGTVTGATVEAHVPLRAPFGLFGGWPGLTTTATVGDIIVLWPSTNASIPTGWSRETALDDLYPRGTPNATDPGGTGGALTHTHTTQTHNHSAAHTHTVPNSPAASGNTSRDPGNTHAPDAHTHTGNPSTTNPTASLVNASPSTDAINNEPPFFRVIFIKPTAGIFSGVPNNAVTLWNNSSVTPDGWNLADGGGGRPDMRSTFLKGAAAGGGDGGGTGGGATHTHTVASHDHGTDFSHDHPAVTSAAPAEGAVGAAGSGAQVSTATGTHTHALTIGTQATDAITGNTDTAGSTNHEPPFLAQAFIQNNSGGDSWPDRIIALWLGTLASIPLFWKLCDGTLGTPDLRSTYVKGAATLGGIGGTGGSLTHGHTATGHTHAVASHTHTVSAGSGAGSNIHAGSTVCSTTGHTHPSWSNTSATSFTSGTGTPTVDNYTDTQPPFKNVAFIQFQQEPLPAYLYRTWASAIYRM